MAGGIGRAVPENGVCFIRKAYAAYNPVTVQVQEIKQGLEQVTQMADAAMDLALTNQDSARQMQTQQDWATEKNHAY